MDKERQIELEKQIRSDFAFFKTEKGRRILQYLMTNNFVIDTTMDESGRPFFQSYKEGRRTAILDILALAGIDLTNLGE